MELRENVLSFQKNIKNLSTLNLLTNDSLQVNQASIIGIDNINNDNSTLFVDEEEFNNNVKSLSLLVDYAPWWIIALISISL
jgi:hypothetical protein